MHTADDTSDPLWDNVHHIFFNNKRNFEYNMAKLVALGKLVAKLKSVNTCAKAANQDSNNAMSLRISILSY